MNPLLADSPHPLGYPAFDRIEDDHFLPAYEAAMAEHLDEIEAIARDPEPPTFKSVIVAIESSGSRLHEISRIFSGLVSADSNPARERIRSEMAPRLAAHWDTISLHDVVFEKVRRVWESRDTLDLDAESERLLEKTHKGFVRAGAALSPEGKARLKAINAELATLGSRFTQNVLAEVNAKAVVVESEDALSGLSDADIDAAARAAADRGLDDAWILPLVNTTGQPKLAVLENRALRETIHRESVGRGHDGGEHDNREIVARTVALRAERATLLGYDNHAHYALEEQTALTADAVNERLRLLARPAASNAQREAEELTALLHEDDPDATLEAWDWSFYAERLRKRRYDYDDSELKPYFELDSVLVRGAFFAAERLFGLRFEETDELPVYHRDVRTFRVLDEDGLRALFVLDPYARPAKRGGAWMSAYVLQSKLLGTRPVVGNHLNIAPPPDGEPTLLTFDEVETLFHEFGHAIHGMLSEVTYPRFSGTRVPRDFVEFPSQWNEMWVTWPEVLENYAVHHRTGEPMPRELVQRVLAARTFNQGFATSEYLAAAVIDQAWHQLGPDEVPGPDEVMAFEADALRRAGLDHPAVPPRYRSTYFSHIMGSYAAGYYSYIWAEVLDADAVAWFAENGGLTRSNGEHLRQTVLSRGGSREAMSMYEDFRGSAPRIEPLLERRGLSTVSG